MLSSNDGFLRLYTPAGTLLRGVQASPINDGYGYLYTVAASAANQEIYTGGDDGVLTVWSYDLSPRQRIPHGAEIYSIAALQGPLAGDIAVGCGDGSVCLWSRRPPPVGSVLQGEVGRAAWAGPSAKAAALDAAPNPRVLEGDAAAAAARVPSDSGYSPVGPGGATRTGGTAATRTRTTTGGSNNYDYTFPVDLGTGQALSISWNRGDDPSHVGLEFCRQNGITTDQLPDIINFIHTAQQAVGGGGGEGTPIQQTSGGPQTQAAPSASSVTSSSPEEKAHMLEQVMAMGVAEAEALGALEATQWAGIEAALSVLFGG